LAETGKLVLLGSEQDVRTKLSFARRERPKACTPAKAKTLDAVVNHVIAVAGSRG